MKLAILEKSVSILRRGDLSVIDQLNLIRRQVKYALRSIDEINAERAAMRRTARKLKKHLPFTQYSIDRLLADATEHRQKELDGCNVLVEQAGLMFLKDPEGSFAAIGMARACDFLGIGRQHRKTAWDVADQGFAGLIFIERLENTAEGLHDNWGSGGPLYRACLKAAVKFIRECPDDQLPDDPRHWLNALQADGEAQ